MRYRFLLFILLFFIATFYIVVGGITHDSPGQKQIGSDSWDTGNLDWEMDTDESADHSTITAYASANVTRIKRENANGSGSEDEFEEYAFGHARVSASNVTITTDGKSKTHKPKGYAYHSGNIYLLYDGQISHYPYIKGDNNDMTDYTREYNEATSAYNRYGYYTGIWYLKGFGDGNISNRVEKLLNNITKASAQASAP